jgi:peptide/nickel transport system substrate-binding protein
LQEHPAEAGSTPKKSAVRWIAIVLAAVVILSVVAYSYASRPPPGPVGNSPPVPRALASRDVVDVGQTVELDATTSSDSDGSIVAYDWTLGNGRSASGRRVSVSYDTPGTFIILLTVTDNAGARREGLDTLVLLRVLQPGLTPSNTAPPTAIVTADATVVRVNESVGLDGSNSWAFFWDGAKWAQNRSAITSYAWDFADGGTSTAAATSHAWSSPGNYPVTLEVTATNGATAKVFNTIQVLPPLVPYTGAVPNPRTYFKAVVWEPAFIDPIQIFDYVAGEVLMNTYEKLLAWAPGDPNTLVPSLATEVPTVENGRISPDGLTYRFTIRQGVRFADGTTLTPGDVEYTFERLLTMNPPGAFGEAPFLIDPLSGGSSDPSVIDNAVEVQGQDVVFTLRYTYAPLLQVLAGINPSYILSKAHVIANGGWNPADPSVNWSGRQDLWVQRHTMGTGPYHLVRWDPSQRLIFQTNPYHWRGPPAGFTTVVLLIAPEASTRIALLKAGDADQADITPQFKSQVEGEPGIRIISGGRTAFIHFTGFSQNVNMARVPCCTSGINATFFSDLHVRRGMNYAMPYDLYLQSAYQNLAVRYNTPIPPPMWANDPTVPLYPFDQAKAAEEFKLAWGGSLTNPGPVWQNGFDFTLYHEPNDEMQIRGELLAQSLRQINPAFTLKVQVLDVGPLIDLLLNNALPMWMFWWGGYFWDPHIYAFPMMHRSGWVPALGGYRNATVDTIVEQAARELNQTMRYQMYQEIQWASYYDVPVIRMEQPLNFHVFRDWISGYVFNPAEGRQSDHWDQLLKG